MIRLSRFRLHQSLCRQKTLTFGNRILCFFVPIRLVNKVQRKKNQLLTQQPHQLREAHQRGQCTLEEVDYLLKEQQFFRVLY